MDDGDCVSGNCDECPISGKSRECEKKQVKSNETTWITRSEVRDIELFLSLLVEKGTIPLTERHFYKELSLVHMKEMDKMKDLHEKLVKRFHVMGNEHAKNGK